MINAKKVKGIVEKIQSQKEYAGISTERLQQAVDAALCGDFKQLAIIVGGKLAKTILLKCLYGLFVLIALFFIKWWIGLIGIIVYLLYVIFIVFYEVKKFASMIGMNTSKLIREFISDIF